MSETENNGAEEVVIPEDHSTEGMAAPGDEGINIEPAEDEQHHDEIGVQEVTLLGKININEGSQEIEITDAVLSEGATWVKKPEGTVKPGEPVEFDVKGEIVPYYSDVKGTISLGEGSIQLFFILDGADNHVSYDQGIGPTIEDSITHGPNAQAHWTITR